LSLATAGNGNKGDTITVNVTPNDGTIDGATVNDSATVVNSAPVATVSQVGGGHDCTQVTSSTRTPSSAGEDAVSLHYVWKNGATVRRAPTTTPCPYTTLFRSLSLATAGNGNKGDTITVNVTPNDGTIDGATVNDSATVVNSAPVATVS